MRCLHLFCPTRAGPGNWTDVVSHPDLKLEPGKRAAVAADLTARFGALASPAVALHPPDLTPGPFKALLRLCWRQRRAA